MLPCSKLNILFFILTNWVSIRIILQIVVVIIIIGIIVIDICMKYFWLYYMAHVYFVEFFEVALFWFEVTYRIYRHKM